MSSQNIHSLSHLIHIWPGWRHFMDYHLDQPRVESSLQLLPIPGITSSSSSSIHYCLFKSLTGKIILIHACSVSLCVPPLTSCSTSAGNHLTVHPDWQKGSLRHKLTKLRELSDTPLPESKPITRLLSVTWIYTVSLQQRKHCVTWSPHDWPCSVQWSYSSLQRTEILLIFYL